MKGAPKSNVEPKKRLNLQRRKEKPKERNWNMRDARNRKELKVRGALN